MTRDPRDRLEDIRLACEAIGSYLDLDPAIADGRTFDAICLRLIVIGEAIKDLPDSVTTQADDVPWSDIARMRDRVAHRYFDTDHSLVISVARNRVPSLLAAVERLLSSG